MSDIYIPGVKSQFDTEKIIEDLMKIERAPKVRAEKAIEDYKTQKTIWQDVGRRISTVRESARTLYSFQNPFSERVANSQDPAVITATARREASEQTRTFTVKQLAAADRFLSSPLPENYRIPEGTYTFTIGEETFSFTFRGGSLKEFAEAITKRGKDRLRADVVTVEPGTRSLLIESKVTGSTNRLSFKDDSEKLALATGMVERIDSASRTIVETPQLFSAGTSKVFTLSPPIQPTQKLVLAYETATTLKEDKDSTVQEAPSGPQFPGAGSITYGGITIENDPSTVDLPPWTPPPVPPRVDDLSVVTLVFSDGTKKTLPPIRDSTDFVGQEIPLTDFSEGKAISAVEIQNKNTHRDVSIRNLRIFNPEAREGLRPKNAISTAQDAILAMDGIEVRRPKNDVDDLIPGVTVTLTGVSDKPVKLTIEPDRKTAKEAIITLVGNYNRLMAELNVLARTDDKIVQELTYLSKDEQEEMQKKLGTLQGDSTINTLRSSLQRLISSSYPTSLERELALLAQIGISTDARKAGSSQGYDPARLRGYLEIDEKTLDEALAKRLPAVKELFGNDTDGDLVIDSGFAYQLNALLQPYVQTGGIIALKTSGLDTRISEEQKRIEALDKQLAAKEASLRRQYGQMEGALQQMQKTSNSLEQLNNQSNR
ncbi:MAG TPA: flagellar filament capping protein FliD [Termitinemataceae bacterium]|nr:flagellar filament capping protein FliD [Termitinemataceae bacterium]HOM23578.1 flagellar filament capping protein FliD [Termitinemataceae bacterium]HPP99841.1 flagellar filament capping protein FliD [Termitinemataceae bacterium]